ncbi:hypothetical protein U1Q18_019358 [Sarracenia purpurea var. burkii]
MGKTASTSTSTARGTSPEKTPVDRDDAVEGGGDAEVNFDVSEFFDFSDEGTYGLEWVNKFLLDDHHWLSEKR